MKLLYNKTMIKSGMTEYHTIHVYIGRKKTKSGACIHCKEKRKTVWANVDNKYTRNLEDYIELCYSCHVHYDIKHNGMKITGRPRIKPVRTTPKREYFKTHITVNGIKY